MFASETLLTEYLPLFLFLGVAFGLSVVMVIASLIIGFRKPYEDKLAAYECGFDAFSETRNKFDVRFYLVAILFTLFDLEVIFLFPWALSLGDIGLFGFWSMIAFLSILLIGFVYEWKKGALEWE